MKKYIIVAGNIGAGKSTLVKHLCKKTNWLPYYEPVAENPYLKDFYQDMKKWAFHSQLFFLSDRMAMYHEMQNQGKTVVQDRSIYEDAEIFARNLYEQGKFAERDYSTYWKIYQAAAQILQAPDLLVYLQASLDSLKRRIHQRSRQFETAIPQAYLAQLNRLYDNWVSSFTGSPKLIMNIDDYDILENQDDLDAITQMIQEKIRFGQKELFEDQGQQNISREK